ncbi:MAG: 4-hydroxy-3-methylbut-2-enyl diphosphate reductase [Caldimicrobium sp.]|nr:4-hydroxy-3-methylbut-2-enyl diphosphate reductase [Caldimicrobium sp.]MDW8182943.1 4-hydroxy-3-methylbut-2-enyl diphosphate reductase [Caldimicrobium sp.]
MEIKIAKKAGFCMGVRRAVNLVLKALNEDKTPLYTYGPLIHNPQTLELLNSLGVKILKHVNDEVQKGTCVIRAHGVPPKEMEALEKKHTVIDGTCPRVQKVQALAKRAKEQSKKVIIIGDRDHAEVKGILGYCNGHGFVVSSYEDIEKLPPLEDYLILSQTTQDEEVFDLLAEEILSRYPGGEVVNTICNATEVRQSEVRRLCKECQAIVVIGGKFSANTVRLAQIARDEGKEAYLIERTEELPLEVLKRHQRVGVTAGASTPNWLINEVVDRLKSSTSNFYRAFKAFHILAFHEALGILLLLMALSLWIPDLRLKAALPLFAFVFFTQLFRKNAMQFLLRDTFKTYYPLKEKAISKHRGLVFGIIAISFIIALLSGFLYNPWLVLGLLFIIFIDWLLFKSPLAILGDFLFFSGLLLLLYPHWNETLIMLSVSAMTSLLWCHLYKELIYLQSDGFLPKSFLILSLPLGEKKWQKLLFYGLIILVLPFLILSFRDLTYLFLILMLPLYGMLLYLLRQRPLGQILYLESMTIFPHIWFLLLNLGIYLYRA